MARLEDIVSFSDRDSGALGALATPPPGAVVVIGSGAVEEPLAASRWRDCPRVGVASSCGSHEAAGSIAMAVAVAKVARGDAPAAMFVGTAGGRGYAGTVWPSDRPA
jgi:hypothetical protein